MIQGVSSISFTKYGLSCGWSTIHLMIFKILEQKITCYAPRKIHKQINTTDHRHKHVLTLYYHYPQLTMIDKQNRLNDIKNTNMYVHTYMNHLSHIHTHTLIWCAHHIYKVRVRCEAYLLRVAHSTKDVHITEP